MTPTERQDQESADQDETGPEAPEELQEAVADMLAAAPDGQAEGSSDADGAGGEHPEPPKQSEIPDSTRPAPASERRTPREPATTRPPKPGRRRRVDPGERRSALSELSALGEDSAEQDVSRDSEPEEQGTADAPEEPQITDTQSENKTQPTRDPREASDLMRQLRELSATEESEDQ